MSGDAPKVTVELDGAPVTVRLIEVRVVQCLGLPAQCELAFAGAVDAAADTAAAGAQVRVSVAGQAQPLFNGTLAAVHRRLRPGQGELCRLRAYDALQGLRGHGQTTAYAAMTAGDLAERIAGAHGLSAQTSEPGPRWARIVQRGETDFAVLTEVAARVGLWPLIDGSTLRLVGPAGHGNAIALTLGEGLIELDAETHPAAGAASATATGWDPFRAALRNGTASSPRLPRAIASEPNATAALALAGLVVEDSDQAEALAQTALDRRAAAAATIWGTAVGDTRIVPAARLDLRGVPANLSGTWTVMHAEHTIDAEGYRVRFDTELPPAPTPGRPATAFIGRVSDVADPDRLARVRVTYDALGEAESDWLQVLGPVAGPGRGLVTTPEVGDHVLVLPLGSDPARAVVLGGLWSESGQPETAVSGSRVRRAGWIAPGGHRLWFDDAEGQVLLEHHGGQRLTLDGKGVRLHADGNLLIDAPGSTITLRAARIDFEKG